MAALTPLEILQNKLTIVQQNLAADIANQAAYNATRANVQDTYNAQILQIQQQIAALN